MCKNPQQRPASDAPDAGAAAAPYDADAAEAAPYDAASLWSRLTYRYAGRDFRLTDIHGEVVKEILA